jgi:hypothetical protein
MIVLWCRGRAVCIGDSEVNGCCEIVMNGVVRLRTTVCVCLCTVDRSAACVERVGKVQ